MTVRRGADFVVIAEYVKPPKPAPPLVRVCCKCGRQGRHYKGNEWCVECRRSYPALTAAQRKYESKFTRLRVDGKRVRVLRITPPAPGDTRLTPVGGIHG